MTTLEVRTTPGEQGLDEGRLSRVVSHFDRYVESRRIAGWLATVSRGGDLVWVGRGGHRDREEALPVIDDTIWRIYSMTKPLVALVVMALYEDGFFDLNDDVGTWIEEMKEPRVFVGGDAANPETAPASGPVRVHHLLTHTSGLTYGFQRRSVVDEIYRNKGYDFAWTSGKDLAGAVADWGSCPLLFEPGAAFNYSVAYDVLGRLIEIWTGRSLAEVFRERLLDPLGLADTMWWCPPDRQDRLARLYLTTPAEAVAFDHLGHHVLREPRVLLGGSGLVSTAGDFERVMRLLLGRGELEGVRVVSRATLELMTRNHLSGGGDLASLARDSYADVEYTGVGYGYGGFVMADGAANRCLISDGSYGWGSAASATFWVDPAEDLAVAFYTQLFPTGAVAVRRELQQLVYSSLSD